MFVCNAFLTALVVRFNRLFRTEPGIVMWLLCHMDISYKTHLYMPTEDEPNVLRKEHLNIAG
jgi:hypothetical protein